MHKMSTEDNSEISSGDKLPPTEGMAVTEKAPDPPREKMIDTAIKFLQNPQVRSSPLAQKKAFLQKKGVSAEEIEIAIDRSGTRQDVPRPANQTPAAPTPQGQVPMGTYHAAPPQQQMVPYMPPPPPARVTTWRDYAAIAVIISGVSFGLYKLIMRFLAPWLKSRREEKKRMERIEESIKELNQNVTKTVEALQKSVGAIQELLEKQDTQLSALNAEVLSGKALANSRRSTDATEIKAEITSLKGLLLSRHQFPSTPQRTQIPPWQQRSNDQTPTKTNSPPPSTASETNGSPSPSPLAPLAQEPSTNGAPAIDSDPTPVTVAMKGGDEEEALKPEGVASPADNQTESQALPAVNGMTRGTTGMVQQNC